MLRQYTAIQGEDDPGIRVNEAGQDQSFGLDVTYEDEVWRHKSNLKTGWINTLVQWILAHVKSEDSADGDVK